MSNADILLPYKLEMEVWLKKKGYAHPKVTANNRLPTREEIFDAVESAPGLMIEGVDCDDFFEFNDFFVVRNDDETSGYEIRIGQGADYVSMHGNIETELLIVEILSHKCEQLLVYPDTGSPAIIVQPGMDVEATCSFWHDAEQSRDSWGYFFSRMYG